MSFTPAYDLAPCPRCSSRKNIMRPIWRYARHTSAKRGVRCYTWGGACEHSAAFFDCKKTPLSDESDMLAVEAGWAARAKELFTEMTARWTLAQRSLHARAIGLDIPSEPEPVESVSTVTLEKGEPENAGQD